MELNKNTGFVVVVLCLSSLITLFFTVDTLFLWTDSAQLKWDISNPEASRMLAITAGLSGGFVLLFSLYLVYAMLKGENVLHLAWLLGWYFLCIGVVFGLLSSLGRQFIVDFATNVIRGALLLVGCRMVKRNS